ncbi:hypothetical protein B0A49_06136 [Cryomyces minteri]|uniref:Mevalonate kinase n=1 Tax=Cryomyces minteri TaxID=331657 RepID=A0A4U0X7C9_9PEZI|nr:hypothetical protein B0A49_06136 [Cryomyces minteri]
MAGRIGDLRSNAATGGSNGLEMEEEMKYPDRQHSNGTVTTPASRGNGMSVEAHSAHGNADHDVSETSSNGARPQPPGTRKESSPLAPAFMVSAPGKVIVFGEHAVVHGKAAMAAAISLRSYLLVTTLSKSQRTVTLRFPDISLSHTWNIDTLPWAAFHSPSKKRKYYDLVTALDPELVGAMQPHLTAVSSDAPPAEQKIRHAAAAAFLYLFLSLGSQQSPPCVYTLRSTIPIGAGLGSSASTSVCISATLLLQSHALAGPHRDQLSEEAEKQLERINRWAFVGELLIHGNPSGVDNTVASGGKAVLFKRTDYNKPPRVTRLGDFPELPLLLVDTRQAKSTAAEVAKVAHLRTTHPAVAGHILDAIDKVTESAHALIASADFNPDDPAALQHLGELVALNHGLLFSLGVSHPKLEKLRRLVDDAGVGWTKLTGAGGGGCAITLLKPTTTSAPSSLSSSSSSPSPSKLRTLQTRLEAEGFEIYTTTLGGDGVGVLMPAVLTNGSAEVGGEVIDQDKFLRAEGREGVERLVGVDGGGAGGERGEWRFWRP